MSTRRSLAFSFLDRYAALLISILSSAILARLLTPEEVGVYSVVMVLLALLSTVRDFGAGQFLVQKRELDSDSIRAVWSIQLGVGVVLSLIILSLSGTVSSFYNDARMQEIMWVLAANYAINPFGSITYAWLMREMRFGALATMRFSAALSGALVSIGLAWQGYGPISLALGSLTSTGVNATIAILYRPPKYPWLPGIRKIREVFSFGSQLTVASILNTITSGAPDFLIGKFQGMEAAGYFSRANGLVSMFRSLVSDAVHSVALPLFAKVEREHGDRESAFLKVISYMTAIGWSFCATIGLLAYSIIRILYGSQWDSAVELASILAVAMAFQVPTGTCQVILTSTGRVPTLLHATALTSFTSLGLIAYGATHSLRLLAYALTLASAINLVMWLFVTRKALTLNADRLLRTLCRSAIVASGTMIPSLISSLISAPRPSQPLLQLVLTLPVSAVAFVATCYFSKHPLTEELDRLLSKAIAFSASRRT